MNGWLEDSAVGEPFHDRVAEACVRAGDAEEEEKGTTRGGGAGSGGERWYLCSFESHGAAATITFPPGARGADDGGYENDAKKMRKHSNKNNNTNVQQNVVPRSFALTSRLVAGVDNSIHLPHIHKAARLHSSVSSLPPPLS